MDGLQINQQAGVISTNLDEIESFILEKVKDYEGYEVSEESLKDDKKVLASLRQLQKELNDARIATKKQWLAPFEAFETRCKKVQALVDEPINLINGQIKQFDEAKKVQKQEHIKELYQQNIGGLERFLPYETVMASNPKWLNASTKDQDILFDLNAMTLKIKNDLSAIEALNSEIKDELIDCYQRSGNDLSKAIARNSQFISDKARVEEEAKHKAEEEAKRKAEEERLKAEEQITEPEKPVEYVKPFEQMKDLVQMTKTVCIRISKDDLAQVKELLDFSDINYTVEGE